MEQSAASSDITLLAPAELQQVAWGENETFLTLKDGSMLTARLVIGADGANSWLRNKADIPLTFWDYQHHALVATIRTEEPHDAVARQVFHGEGILAFLPLSDPHLCSIVWSLSPEEAQRMQQASEDEFNRALNIAFDNRLGLCKVESARQVFPLTGALCAPVCRAPSGAGGRRRAYHSPAGGAGGKSWLYGCCRADC